MKKPILFDPNDNPNPIIQVTSDGQLRYANTASDELLKNWNIQLGDRLPYDLCQTIQKCYQEQKGRLFEVPIFSKIFQLQCIPHEDNIVNLYGFDISKRKQALAKIEQLENHDPLTNLPNRKSFAKHLDKILKNSHTNNKSGAILHIKIERLRLLNQTLGLKTSDALLCEVTTRLLDCLPNESYLSRISDGEFGVILPEIDSHGQVSTIADNVISALKPNFHILGQVVNITSSMGISFFPDDADQTAHVLSNVNLALSRAQGLGHNSYYFYRRYMRCAASIRQILSKDLGEAKIEEQFKLMAQPIFTLNKTALSGFEVLLRWYHPEYGIILPKKFIGMAEELGLINHLGHWILQEACTFAKKCHTHGLDHLFVSVNVSPLQFTDNDLKDVILSTLNRTQFPPEKLTLEITENAVINHFNYASSILKKLQEAGIKIAIDDFGTGYSSLKYLSQLPIDKLKIDRSFIIDMTHNPDNHIIIQSLIEMGHKLGLFIIAEGIENSHQDRILKEFHCDYAQGFYYSEPLPLASFMEFAKHNE